jgi:hypothetical protein
MTIFQAAALSKTVSKNRLADNQKPVYLKEAHLTQNP